MGNWIRKYELDVYGKKTGTNYIQGETINCQFSVERQLSNVLAKATVDVYNLKESWTKILADKGGYSLSLNAGYANGEFSQIFKGMVTLAETEWSLGDVKTHFEAVEAFAEVGQKQETFEYSITNRKTIMDYVCQKSGLPHFYTAEAETWFTLSDTVVMPPNNSNPNSPDGMKAIYAAKHNYADKFSHTGTVASALNSLCGSGLGWTIVDNEIIIHSAGETNIGKNVYTVSETTGLIGFPKRQYTAPTGEQVGATDIFSRPIYGYEIQTLLLPKLKIGDKINLQSKYANGEFSVIKFTHKGDYSGADWTTTMTVSDIALI